MSSVIDAKNGSSTTFIEKLQAPKRNFSGSEGKLGKDAFLQLLVTQMKNQSPLNPQDNAQFVAQLAQFSSLESMQNLTSAVDKIVASNKSSQTLQASTLVGRSVVLDTNITAVDTTKGISGSINVSTGNSLTTVKVYDSKSNLVNTIDLGAQKKGSVNFNWDGKDSKGVPLKSGEYTFKAEAIIDGKNVQFSTRLPAKVTSVTLGSTGDEAVVNYNGGSVPLSKVKSIGI